MGFHSVIFLRTRYHVTILFCVSLLSACSNVSIQPVIRNGTPNGNIDVSRIPNAVPKKESKSKYGNPKSYVVFGKRYYVMDESKGYIEKGIASWYGPNFHGKRTSSGETYDMYAMTAAHKNLPLPTYVKVTNLSNGRNVIVKVNDRGPFHENRIIDLSYTAALKLDIVKSGTGLVEIQAINPDAPYPDLRDKGAPVKVATLSDGDDSFYIQVGSFSELSNAETLRKKLGPLGEHLVKISQVVVTGNTLYRVRIGPLTDIDFADSIVSKLSAYGVFDHHIVVN